MVGEAQHSQWRDDIRNNIKKAMNAMSITVDDPREAARLGMEANIAMEVNKIIAGVMLAERLGDLSFAIYRNDEIVAALSDDLTKGRGLVERLLDQVKDVKDKLDPEDFEEVEQWIANESEIADPKPQGLTEDQRVGERAGAGS